MTEHLMENENQKMKTGGKMTEVTKSIVNQSGLQVTPSANRIHIGVFGKTNSGKSSLINALTGQQVSIVSDVAGTTTDPVYKAMELHPLGPCVFIDTAGFGDDTELGELRQEKTMLAVEKTDIALIVLAADSTTDFEREQSLAKTFCDEKTPVVVVINKVDKSVENIQLDGVFAENDISVVSVSAKTGQGLEALKSALARVLPENYGNDFILGDLVSSGDFVLLVMPQDIQAPKGRLILPQVQTLRELLDRKCNAICVTTDQMENALANMKNPPKLIITDSQVFAYVYERKPKESMLTSFSVLFAAHKGDINYYLEGAKAIDSLTESSRVLIAECCTHAPLSEDIGRVKIPRLLRKKVGDNLQIDMVSGTDFPEDLSDYDLVIQCGACMFNRKYVLSRIAKAKNAAVPMTNYGVAIAHMTGILENVVTP